MSDSGPLLSFQFSGRVAKHVLLLLLGFFSSRWSIKCEIFSSSRAASYHANGAVQAAPRLQHSAHSDGRSQLRGLCWLSHQPCLMYLRAPGHTATRVRPITPATLFILLTRKLSPCRVPVMGQERICHLVVISVRILGAKWTSFCLTPFCLALPQLCLPASLRLQRGSCRRCHRWNPECCYLPCTAH